MSSLVQTVKKLKKLKKLGYAVRSVWSSLPHLLSGEQVIFLDYPVNALPRYGHGKGAHPRLQEILSANASRYRENLEKMLPYLSVLTKIPVTSTPDATLPRWINGYLPAFDSILLYGFVASSGPQTFLEIGSGNSTKFVRYAIDSQRLATRIVSIDPLPRAEVDSLCDEVIRLPLEECSLALFDRLGPNDMLFFDGSHRSFMNSDVTVFFLEVLPRLKPGVLVGIHDIHLPLDYPPAMAGSFYSEQYLLASLLLGKDPGIQVELPARFVFVTPELHAILSPYWNSPELKGVEQHGSSFWFRKLS